MSRIVEAANFAAIKHRAQRRKNADASPYINHPIEVAFILSSEGGIENVDILVAALLHDTIEDTETSIEEIVELFGESVAGLVLECTDDKSLPKKERKRLQIETAPHKSPGAKQIKIADKISNLRANLSDPPVGWSDPRRLEYFQWAEKVLAGLRGANPTLDAAAASIVREGLEELSK